MPSMQESQSTKPSSKYAVSKSVVVIDYVMERIIKIGGIGVIAAVSAIFVFIFLEILPLFQTARVTKIKAVDVPTLNYVDIGVDEWGEKPFLLDKAMNAHFINLTNGEINTIKPDLPENTSVTAFEYEQESQTIVCGLSDGRFCLLQMEYAEDFTEDEREIIPRVETSETYEIGHSGVAIDEIASANPGDRLVVAALQSVGERKTISLVRLERKQSLLSSGELEVDEEYDLTDQVEGKPMALRAGSQADALLVATNQGRVYYFRIGDDDCELLQVFQPFSDLPDPSINTIDYLFGGVSVVVTSNSGENRIFSLYIPPGSASRLFGQTKSFPKLSEPAKFYSPSLRNKVFIIGNDHFLSLRFATSNSIRWEETVDYPVADTVINSKYNRLLVLDENDSVHLYNLDDPHPESGIATFFKKQWFEGSAFPKFEWQSTGATDDYEPKLSMVPLIVGTLKGTLYAMLFATPLALTAALYTSQFVNRRVRAVVKPTMEIMASLPSVVLGFLGALWLAPLIETRLVFVFLLLVALPVTAIILGYLWSGLPKEIRRQIPEGNEFIFMVGLVLVVSLGCWYLSPFIEHSLFSTVDPSTGLVVTDFRQWWRYTTNTPFEQRNSLIVGFAMGFAVIPIIFSIAEDSLSNVPSGLTSGAFALGASRWQTAIRIVIPTASAGIFSALMMGLGRAVGETMIVLMATGNTPVMDLNMFTGMRTLSANIAVELPEAPHGGTLYRALFLGALLLFVFTFIVNTFAVTLREHIRSKYKTV